MKDKVQEAIQEYESNFFYGQATVEMNEKWNYTVFRRTTVNHSRNSEVDNYELAIVRENYVTEKDIKNIINAITTKTSLKLREEQIKFEYLYNPKNSIVCEVVLVNFYKSKKVCYE